MARDTKAQRIARFYADMAKMGFSYDEAQALRRIEMTLRSWSELECGSDRGAIERDETTGKPYWISSHTGKRTHAVPDREAGALKRLAAIMAKHPDLIPYHQTDPRGCALYVVPNDRIPAGTDIDAVYNRGFGVCY